MKQEKSSIIGHIIFGFFTLLTFVLMYFFIFEKDAVKALIESFKGLVETLGNWNLAIIFLTAFLETLPVIGGFFPGQNLMLIAGGFYSQINLIGVLIFASLGAILGNLFGYFIGKKYGEGIISKYGIYIGVGETELQYLKKGIDKYAPTAFILSKFHNVFRSIIPFLAGIGKMSSKKFWIYTTLGAIIRAVTINLIGMYFVSNYELIIDNIGKIITGLMLAFFAYLYFFKREEVNKYLELKNKEIEDKFGK